MKIGKRLAVQLRAGLALGVVAVGAIGIVAPLTPPALAAEISQGEMEAARSLARANNPIEALYDVALSDLKPTMRTELQGVPEFVEIETLYPGFVEFFIQWTYDFMKVELDLGYPQVIDALAVVYANHMTVAEIKQADAFFRSPTGQKMVNKASRSTTLSSATEDCVAEGKQNCLKTGELRSANRTAVQGAYNSLSPKEKAQADAFAQSPAGRSFSAAGPASLKAIADWTNDWFARMQNKMSNQIPDVVGNWIAEQEEQKQKKTGE